MDKLDAMTAQVRDFCDARDWRKYHTPKELAIGMATESSELLQLFRFMSDERIAEMFEDAEQRQAIEDEVADTLLFLLRFTDLNDIDLPAALSSKLKRNGERYSIDTGSNEYRKAGHHE
ncbi:nucleotide pyrophosphohydrolase [Collinsella aerofaciens]|uniref:nucleotide pyrophosphohydrolase n=1 Tax=Collinsella aerofaciens TaxID=74426 RepID=UPI0018999EC5|nr:nucleotide pyrophosphohydrolase [Collinsella aerofaciens]MDB1828838.1 nucleotide pyrophosphohydrolase [Collinsella aerofaciens]